MSMTGESVEAVVFSPCGKYRYERTRTWDASKPTLAFCGLNPGSNRPSDSGPTATKFRTIAERLGYGSYVSVNLWAFIEKDPEKLRAAGYPDGPENEAYLERAFTGRDVICMWGNPGAGRRSRDVFKMILRVGGTPFALAVNKNGTPRHPLYTANDTDPQPYTIAGA